MSKNLSLNCYEFENNLVDCYEDRMGDIIGIHYIFRFQNGYGASVVKTSNSIGYEDDLWELAILLYDEENKLSPDEYVVIYIEEITNDDITVGNLTNEKVIEYLQKISKLN